MCMILWRYLKYSGGIGYALTLISVSSTWELEVVKEPSINPKVNVSAIAFPKPSLMGLIIEFLAEDCLPRESREADKVRKVAIWFWLSKDRILY